MNQTTKKNFNRIVKCLYDAKKEGSEFLWVREIERRTQINMGTVVWILYRYLNPEYIDMPETDDLISKGLKIQPIKLKDSVFDKLAKDGLE
ncbi:MAG: hypothetical protein ABIG20_05295 [archaeon]